jgi:hypothetical protein
MASAIKNQIIIAVIAWIANAGAIGTQSPPSPTATPAKSAPVSSPAAGGVELTPQTIMFIGIGAGVLFLAGTVMFLMRVRTGNRVHPIDARSQQFNNYQQQPTRVEIIQQQAPPMMMSSMNQPFFMPQMQQQPMMMQQPMFGYPPQRRLSIVTYPNQMAYGK